MPTGLYVRTYEVVGWISPQGPAEYRRLRWLGTLDDVRRPSAPSRSSCSSAARGRRRRGRAGSDERYALVADACLDLPVRMIDANQLYEELLRPRAARDHGLGLVPLHHASALPADVAALEAVLRPRRSASMAVFVLPLIVIAGVAIKLADGGPIFYRQRRVGERGKEFEILKLRTMAPTRRRAARNGASAGDERVTRLGRFLRRTHIDELPQLWNVLRGEMTLVGPRPERPEIFAELESRFPHYTRRHLVKPGITGWAAASLRLRRLRARHRVEALPRPLLHQAPLDAGRLADHRRDRRSRPAATPIGRCALRASGSSWVRTSNS